MLVELKGPGTCLAVIVTEQYRIELLRFVDHSWGIRREGVWLGVWEPERAEECWRYLYHLAQGASGSHVRVLVVGRTTLARAAQREHSPLDN